MDPVIVPRSEHSVSRKLIDADAVKVLYRLHRAGYHGYLVGGGVRDLLLDRQPKDFDISTDANPQEVKQLFRNCRLIGRRFRLAHVHFGGKIVEVATFRRRSEPEEGEDNEDILIRSDNTFGTAEEDALRRDFTINGLFYDIGTFSLIDYVGGLEDLKQRTVRTIGDPDIRFREDPVRMIRAIKFAARLDFTIEPETWNAILRQREEIRKSARPRVLEEIFRLLTGGASETSFRLLARSGLLSILLPELGVLIEPDGDDSDAEGHRTWLWLRELDKRREQEEFQGANALAVLLAEMTFGDDEADDDEAFRLSPDTEERLRSIFTSLSLPRRDAEKIFQIYRAQRRLVGQRGRRFSPKAFLHKHYFRDVFQLFSISVAVTGRHEEALARWEQLAEGVSMTERPPSPARRRRRRRRRDSDMEAVDRGQPHTNNDSTVAQESATRPAAGHRPPPPPRPAEEDEDSQIRFLGWSDEPEILRSPTRQAVPIPNPYHRNSGRSGSQRPSRPSGGFSNGRRFERDSGGSNRPPGSRRDGGRRGGRRKPRSRQD